MKRFIALTSLLLSSLNVMADSSENFSLLSQQDQHQSSLRGVVSHTLYRTEEYEATCSREVAYTAYERRCEAQYQRVCENIPTRECSTQAVCRDVMREVCGPTGCRRVPTRECTNEQVCRDVPRPVCRDVRVADRCFDIPVTRYRTEYYTCIKTRQVPAGTQVDHDRIVNASFEIVGDVRSLSGQDQMSISVAHGNDISDYGVRVSLAHASDSHFIYLRKVSENQRSLGRATVQIDVAYEINVIAVSRFMKPVLSIDQLNIRSGVLVASVSGTGVDATTAFSLDVKKDQRIGGYTTIFSEAVSSSKVQISGQVGSQQVAINLAALGIKINKRPHRATVSMTAVSPGIDHNNLLNESTIERAGLKASASKMLQFK